MSFRLITWLAFACYAGVASAATEVVADGTGATREQAVNNAFVAASEQASGVFVASDQRLEDGKITKDEIRQHTAGVVNNYEVVSCDNDGGIYNCRIKCSSSDLI